MSQSFSDRIFVVTAANSGIGEKIVTTLLDLGATVIATTRKDRRLSLTHERLISFQSDLLSQPDCEALALQALEVGGIAGLVHVAGAWVPGGIEQIDESVLDYAFAANVKTAFNVCRSLLPQMQDRGRGSIVTIASMLGISPVPNCIAYASTKAALIQFTRALALDQGPRGIRCNCICPGLVETYQTANVFSQPDWVGKIVRSYPMGRLGRPTDVAAVAAFLLTDEAEWITGLALPVDGGYLISAEGS